MIGHAAHRGVVGIANACLDLRVAEIVIDWFIEIDFAGLYKGHKTGRCHCF